MNTYMSRWVEARGTQVQFGNLVGPYMGKPYIYECRTPRDATAFAAFLKQRDPQDDNLPVAVTDADLATYHATQSAR